MRWDEWYNVVCSAVAEAVELAKIPAAQTYTGSDTNLRVYVGDGNLKQVPFVRVVLIDAEPTETQQLRDVKYTKHKSITTKDLHPQREYLSFGLFITSNSQVQALRITQAVINGMGWAGTLTAENAESALFDLSQFSLQASEDSDGNITRYTTTLTLKISVISERTYSHQLISRIKNVIME